MADEPKLVVGLEARLDKFEKQLKEAGLIAKREVEAIEGQIKSVAIGTAIGNLLAKGIEAAMEAAKKKITETIEQLQKMEETAVKTGVSFENLQKIGFATRASGVTDKDLFAGLDKLGAELDEINRKENDLSKFLDANGLKYKDRTGAVIDANKALELAASLMGKAASEFEKIEIAKKFGLTKEWVRVIGEGEEAFRKLKDQARIDPELARNAQVLDIISKLVSTIKADFDSWGTSLITLIGPAIIENLIRPMQALAQIMQEMTSGTIFEESGRQFAERMLGVADRFRNAMNEINKPRVEVRLRAKSGVKGLGDEAGDEKKNALDRANQSLAKSIELSKAELATVGLTVDKQEEAKQLAILIAAAKKAGLDADTAITQEMKNQVTQAGALKLQIAERRRLFDELVSSSKEFGSALSDGFKGMVLEGKKLDETLRNVAQRLAGRAIDKLFDLLFAAPASGGVPPFLKLLGVGLPGKAAGGPVGVGRPYMVGERGPEIFVPERSGRIVPNSAMGSGRSGDVTIGGANVVINGNVGDAELIAIQAALSAHEKRLNQQARAMVSSRRFAATGVQ